MTGDQLRALRYLRDKCHGFGDHTIRAGDVAEFVASVIDQTPRMREPFFPTGVSTTCAACGTYKAFHIACEDCLRSLHAHNKVQGWPDKMGWMDDDD